MQSSARANAWIPLLIVALVAGSVRFAHLDALRESWSGTALFSIPRGDAAYHWSEATTIAQDDFFLRDRVPWKGPGYSYFLAALRTIAGDDLGAVRWLLALIGVFNCVGITLLARRLLPSSWAIATGVLVGLNGVLVLFDTEPLFPTLLVALNLPVLWVLGKPQPGNVRLILAGFLMGISALVHPVYLVPGAILSICRATLRRREGLVFALGIVIAISPLALQNLMQRGQPVLISWSGGVNVYIGNQPCFDQSSGQSTAAWGRVLKTTLASGITGEAERDATYYRLALKQLRDRPVGAAAIILEKARILFSPVEISNNMQLYELRGYSWPLSLLLGRARWFWWPAGLWIPAALLGLWTVLRKHRAAPDSTDLTWGVLGWWSLGLIITILLSFNTARYRAPLIFFSSLWVTFWLIELRTRFRLEGWRGMALPLAQYAILLAIVASFAKTQTDLPAPAEWSQARYLERQNPRAAEILYLQALEQGSGSPALRLSVSNFFGRTDRPQRQIQLLEGLLENPSLEPDLLALAYEGTARAQLHTGNLSDARSSVLRAIALNVDQCEWNGQPYFQLGLVPASECKFRLLLAEIELAMGNRDDAALQLRLVHAGCPDGEEFSREISSIAARLQRSE